MQTYKSITNIPGIVDLGEDYSTSYDLKTGSQAYGFVSTVHRAVRLRCDSLSQVPVTIRTPDGTEKEWPFPGITPKTLLWRIEAALLIYGASYFLKRVNQRDRTGRAVKDLQYLNPSTMSVKRVDGRLVFSQTIGTQAYGPWPQEHMVYLAEWDPDQDVLPGIAPVQVALGDAGLIHYMNNFATQFFKSGAMPVTLVGLERPVNESERERSERKISRMISGLANAFRVRLLNSPVTPIQLTPPLDKLALKELDERANRAIAKAFGIPQTMLEDAANFATADSHRSSFWQDTIRPHGEWIQDELNRQLFNPMGLEMVMEWEEMDVFQVDEAERAESLTKLTSAGVPLELALEILGYDLSEEQWKKLRDEKEQNEVTPPETTTESPPQDQPAPTEQPAEKSKAPETGGLFDSWPRPTGTLAEVREELVKYQRKALDSLDRGRSPAVIWNSEYLPDEVKAYVHLGLTGCLTADEVRGVFNAAFGWLNYGT